MAAAAAAGAMMQNPMSSVAYGGVLGQGFAPTGENEDIMNMIRRVSADAERASNAAKYSQHAAYAAGVAAQQAVIRSMQLLSTPGVTLATPLTGDPVTEGLISAPTGTQE